MSLQNSQEDADLWYERLRTYLARQDERCGGDRAGNMAFQLGFATSMLAGLLAGRDLEQVRRQVMRDLGEAEQ